MAHRPGSVKNFLFFVTFVDFENSQISCFMEKVHDFLVNLDRFIGGHTWFIVLLLGTGIFFTIYLKFPQFRYFRHAIRVVRGKFDKKEDVGDATHFQALATALSDVPRMFTQTGMQTGCPRKLHCFFPCRTWKPSSCNPSLMIAVAWWHSWPRHLGTS